MNALAILALAGLSLRCVSTRLPYRRAGLQFETGPERGLGFVLVPASDLDEGDIELLLADANIDVSLGIEGKAFIPVADIAALEDLIAGLPDEFTKPADKPASAGSEGAGAERQSRDTDTQQAAKPAAAPAAAKPTAKRSATKKPAETKAPTE